MAVTLLVLELCRSGRRQILNDKELVDMLSKEVDAELLEFVEMSYKEQVNYGCNLNKHRSLLK